MGICQKQLNIDRPSYLELNVIIAKVISSMTASLRFDGELNVDLGEFQTNLVPFPRLHFMTTALAPVISKDRAISVNYRGEIKSKEANATVQWLKQNNKISFVEWCPTGFKVGLNEVPAAQQKKKGNEEVD